MTEQNDLFGIEPQGEKILTRRHAITDEALAHFREPYGKDGEQIQKDDVFYFIYGLLHSDDYREKYADNLSKQLPRIPRPKTFADFCHFANAGLDLAELHLNYESVPCYDSVTLTGSIGQKLEVLKDGIVVRPSFSGSLKNNDKDAFMVAKMKHPKKDEKETIIYNNGITVNNIPLEAYDYIVNGKSAIEWVMERQAITTDKNSGITNNANDYANETMNNPRYPLELLLRVITVSLETMKIVNNLPKLDVLES